LKAIPNLLAILLLGCTTSFDVSDGITVDTEVDTTEDTSALETLDDGEDMVDWLDIGTDTQEDSEEPDGTDGDGDGVSVEDGDCCDSNPAIYPGQTGFFTYPHNCWGTESWDYDCDSSVTMEYIPDDDRVLECQYYPIGCDERGWHGSAPSCGDEALYVRCATIGSGGSMRCGTAETLWSGTMGCR